MDEKIINDLNLYIKKHRSNIEKSCSLSEYIFLKMREKNIDNASIIYQKANMSKQTYSAIIKSNSASLNSCIKLVFALNLNNHECKLLLKKAGYTLSSSKIYSLIIRYSIENNLTLDECDELLRIKGYDSLFKD